MITQQAQIDTGSPPDGLNRNQLALILAAEREFAKEGIDQASLRRIATLAGNGNNNAVQYHFESREGLVLALLRYRVGQMEARRREMLHNARLNGKLGHIPTLARSFCLPQLDLQTNDGDFPYARFLLQFYALYKDKEYRKGVDIITSEFPAIGETRRLLIDAMGYDQEWAHRRITAGFTMFLGVLVRHAGAIRSGLPTYPVTEIVEDAMEMVIAGLCAPSPLHGTQAVAPSEDDGASTVERMTLAELEEENQALKDLIGELSVERSRRKVAR